LTLQIIRSISQKPYLGFASDPDHTRTLERCADASAVLA
jgi:hypothetical protein